MRFAILGISHETNTFSRVPADYGQFERSGILRGDELVQQYGASQSTIAGYLEACAELGIEAVPLMHARTGPIGTITKDAYDRLSGEMFGMLRRQGPWDGVLIANHGAAVSEEFPDMDGEFCRAVREIVGADVPVGITLDMHANVSQKVVANTTCCVVWRTNPHLDTRERGKKTATLIFRTANGEVRPVQWLEMPPMVINIVKQFTGEEPMKGLVADAVKANERPGILDTSVAEGYPYADVEEMGMSFLAISDGDEAAARDAAQWMASRAWARRAEMTNDIPGIREALEMATGAASLSPGRVAARGRESERAGVGARAAGKKGPVVLMDVGDNIGGGSSADSTFILAEAQRMGVRSFLQSLYDPEAVKTCVRAGVGAEVTLAVGARTDDMHGKPVKVTGTVRVISDGKYEETGPNHGGGRYFNGGVSVRLDTTDGHTLLLTSRRTGNTTRQQMYSTGIRPEEHAVVVAKGVVSPRPAYEPIAREIILVNTPGVTTADLSTFTYRRRRRPLYPFEGDATYS